MHAQPWMKDYVCQAEFKVLYKKVWAGPVAERIDVDPMRLLVGLAIRIMG